MKRAQKAQHNKKAILVRCAGCEHTRRYSASFRTLAKLWLHMYRCDCFRLDSKPSLKDTIDVLDRTSYALHHGISLNEIPELKQWGILVE